MVSAPFATNNTVTKGTKLPEKRNRYQKVIICTSEPRRLIFDYCGAIFALPEAFFFGYSGAIFEWLKVSFHCQHRKTRVTLHAKVVPQYFVCYNNLSIRIVAGRPPNGGETR